MLRNMLLCSLIDCLPLAIWQQSGLRFWGLEEAGAGKGGEDIAWRRGFASAEPFKLG